MHFQTLFNRLLITVAPVNMSLNPNASPPKDDGGRRVGVTESNVLQRILTEVRHRSGMKSRRWSSNRSTTPQTLFLVSVTDTEGLGERLLLATEGIAATRSNCGGSAAGG